jgi:hypothetical protein
MSGLHQALEAISKKTGDLFAVEIDGIEIVFRLPAIRDVQQYAMLLGMSSTEAEKSEVYEALFRRVAEDSWLAKLATDIPAGIPETIGRLVVFLSGLDEHSIPYTEELFKAFRAQNDTTNTYMKRTVCQVFPGYTFENLDLLNYQQLVQVFIQAEKVLLDRGIIQKEHDFQAPEKAKPKPFRVEDVIRKDAQAHHDFEKGDDIDPRARVQMQQVREQAIKRAQEEERKYKQHMIKHMNDK